MLTADGERQMDNGGIGVGRGSSGQWEVAVDCDPLDRGEDLCLMAHHPTYA